MLDELLTGTSQERKEALASVVAGPEGTRRIEAALVDLLRDGDDEVLVALAHELGTLRERVEAERVLETLALRGGSVRAAALRALRGEIAPPASSAASSAGAGPAGGNPAGAASAGAAGAGPAGARSDDAGDPTAWSEPFEAALTDPSREHIARAALALVELADQRPAAARPEAVQALAARLAMASFDHEGEAQQGLSRLARGLKGL